ncbi:ABC transporter ATP-binding protein [Chroococcus sp. FPU101]|uniref:ABC transporter ATP-binding protein n=1 Tax=Chroococcus sp. FPU101 TaxID=1974212 RepID=UPI001A8C5F88|nr:ABC transporter ATP-binding protein [Chroococcus sp. FPU101]GFE68927.1 polysaccharide export ABC-transporter ATP-binding protein [Chroococcus sp. FPU101]
MVAAISVQNVYKLYNQVPVVDNLSFDIEEGEIFGLLGPNGAGKSTTIRMMITLTQPSQGQIQVAGYDIHRHRDQVKRNIGVVLQQISIDGELTVWENMEFHGRMHHIPNSQRQSLIDQWLDYMSLIDRKDVLAKTLSGGMKRRLQIARALLHQPRILFLDEPTVGLDPQNRRRLWEVIRDLNRQGMTILLTTHYMEEVEFLCGEQGTGKQGRIGIMDSGKLIKLGTLTDFRHKYGEGLVIKQVEDHLDYKFFPTLEQANLYLETLVDKTGVMSRASNLEDIFVEMTGHRLD